MRCKTMLTAVAAAFAVGLTSCSFAPGEPVVTHSDLEREATSQDAWPRDLAGRYGDTADTENARLVGHDGDVALYLAPSTENPGGICLLAYKSADEAVAGCAGATLQISGRNIGSYEVSPDDIPIEGRERISNNVYGKAITD